MSTLNTKMTALADEIRTLTATTNALGLDDMAEELSDANDELVDQADLIAQISAALQGKASGGEQVTPEISINASTGLVTATAGSKSSTYQLAFQAAKTITPSTTSQIAVSSGYYTGGNITVAAIPTQSKNVTPKTTSQDVTPDNGKFLSKVTVNAIPSTYIQPTGTLNVTENGTHDVKNYANVNVNIEGGSSSGELVDYSEAEDAMVTGTLSSYTNDRVTTIGTSAFAYCSGLTTVSFPNVIIIGNSAFYSCSRLATISFPKVITIGIQAFQSCFKLTTVSFPNVTTIGNGAFSSCYSLTAASFPMATAISSYAFRDCDKLATVSFPNVTTIGTSAFAYCSGLTTVSFPNVTIIGNSAFYSCYSLTTASFPKATTIGGYAFIDCSNLTTASFPQATTIGSYAFRYCYYLKSLYLTGSSLCTLSNSNAFTSTPVGGYSGSAKTYGSIYVPASLLTTYQSATNWTYFSSRFVGYDLPKLITFTINDTQYQAEEGMTFMDWTESDYNTDGWWINVGKYDTIIYTPNGEGFQSSRNYHLSPETILTDGAIYLSEGNDLEEENPPEVEIPIG